jgi:hypothetical protein
VVLVGRDLRHLAVAIGVLLLSTGAAPRAWGPQGHRLVALVAAARLTPEAGRAVAWLLDGASLADVSVWADQYLDGNNQTSFWHYVNVPADASAYDRERDCPVQPGVRTGGRLDRWRDCVVDRIDYHAQRLGDTTLDRADRAIALKFLVHLIGDLHQPLHALGVERGGNGIPVIVFGSPECRFADGTPYPCNLHGTWDTVLIAHRGLDDRAYAAELERQIAQQGWAPTEPGTAAQWAMESHGLAKAALLPADGSVDDAYYRRHIATVDHRLALAGLRLAAVINRRLTAPIPPSR